MKYRQNVPPNWNLSFDNKSSEFNIAVSFSGYNMKSAFFSVKRYIFALIYGGY